MKIITANLVLFFKIRGQGTGVQEIQDPDQVNCDFLE